MNFILFLKKNELVNETIKNKFQSIMTFDADMGGTEIINPLLSLKNNFLETTLNNRIFIMTDGADLDVEECLNIVEEIIDNKAFNSRFYSLGIGNECNESLVIGIAEKEKVIMN